MVKTGVGRAIFSFLKIANMRSSTGHGNIIEPILGLKKFGVVPYN